MADHYDRDAFLARFETEMKPRIEAGLRGARRLAPPTPAPAAHRVTSPASHAQFVPPTPAKLEFQKVRAATLARIAAKEEARLADERAVAAILAADLDYKR